VPINCYLKRTFDIIFSLGIIIWMSPLMLLIAVLIRLMQGSDVFFFQQRPGLNGQAFKMIKFRTMSNARDAKGQLLPDEERLTPLGIFLRKTSLDELPEFYNVLKGDMSVVGPRPLLMQYLSRYSPKQMRRHEVKPGITGWAQVHGRNAISWEEKFEMDVWYVDNQSFLLDCHIILLTVKQTLLREGIHHEGCATMMEFHSSQN